MAGPRNGGRGDGLVPEQFLLSWCSGWRRSASISMSLTALTFPRFTARSQASSCSCFGFTAANLMLLIGAETDTALLERRPHEAGA